MAIISTPALTVASATTSPSGTPNRLTVVLSMPYQAPLFLRTILVTRSSVVQSSIVPGSDATHGGSAQVNQDSTTFDATCAQAVTPCTVVMTYNDVTMKVVSLTFSQSVAAASA